MVYDKISDVVETIRKNKMVLVRVYFNGNMIWANEEKNADPEKIADDLEEYLTNKEGSGYMEVGLFEKTSAETNKGGATRPKYKFIIRVGTPSGVTGVGNLMAPVSSSREKELRDEVEGLRTKLKDLEWQMKLDEMKRDFKKQIEGLEEKEDTGFGWLKEAATPYLPQIISRLTGQVITAPALAEDVSENRLTNEEIELAQSDKQRLQEFELHEKIDSSVEELEEILGSSKVAELLTTLAEKAKADPKKFESYFPILKNL